MDQDNKLRGAVSWQMRSRQTAEKIGSVADGLLKSRQRTFAKNGAVVDIWEQLVPELLLAHSRLVKISGGTLYVEVQPGAYMHEMQLISGELLENIQGRCPYSGVKKIKLSPLRKIEQQETDDNDRTKL